MRAGLLRVSELLRRQPWALHGLKACAGGVLRLVKPRVLRPDLSSSAGSTSCDLCANSKNTQLCRLTPGPGEVERLLNWQLRLHTIYELKTNKNKTKQRKEKKKNQMGFFVWIDFSSRVFAGHFRVPGTPWNCSRKVKGSKAEPAAQLGQGWGAGLRPAWPGPLCPRALGADRSVELHSSNFWERKCVWFAWNRSWGSHRDVRTALPGNMQAMPWEKYLPQACPLPGPREDFQRRLWQLKTEKTTGLLVYQLKAAPSWPQPNPLACRGTQTEAARSGADSHPRVVLHPQSCLEEIAGSRGAFCLPLFCLIGYWVTFQDTSGQQTSRPKEGWAVLNTPY